jgi:hypothetical protein
MGSDCSRGGGSAGKEGVLLIAEESTIKEDSGRASLRGEGQGVAGSATGNDSVAVAVAPANIAVVAISAHVTWPSCAAQCLPRRPPRSILRLRSLREATEVGVISESLPFRFRSLGVTGVEGISYVSIM